MSKYFKIAVRESRPLQYKNCYDWVMVRFEESIGLCYFVIGKKLNVLPLHDTIEFHKNMTSRKPYKLQTVCFAEFWGVQLAEIDYAAENNLEPQIIDTELHDIMVLNPKKWQGYNLKKVNDLSFIK